MRIYLRAACAVCPVLIGVALGETTVAAMQIDQPAGVYAPPPQQADRYTLGQNWAAKHHPEDADACPTIDTLFESGCIAATRY